MVRALALAAMCLAGVAHAKLKVVVLEVKASDAATKRLAGQLQEQLLTELAGNTRFEVLGKSDIEALLGLERQKQLMGCADGSSCLAELGGALGAQYLVIATVGRAGKRFRVDLKVIDPKESKAVYRGGKSLDREEEIYAAVAELARALAAAIPLEPVVVVEAPPPAVVPVAAPPAAVAVATPASSPWGPRLVVIAGGAAAVAGAALLVFGKVSEGGFASEKAMLTFSQANARLRGIETTYNIGWAVASLGLVVAAAGLVWYLVTR